jgi:hypothetical protein
MLRLGFCQSRLAFGSVLGSTLHHSCSGVLELLLVGAGRIVAGTSARNLISSITASNQHSARD